MKCITSSVRTNLLLEETKILKAQWFDVRVMLVFTHQLASSPLTLVSIKSLTTTSSVTSEAI